MTTKVLFAVALLSLALAAGCAKGGSGGGSQITVTVSDGGLGAIYVGQTVTFTATVKGTTNTAVTWSLSGSACTGTPNPCGTIDSTTGVYQAPATPPSPSGVTITATSQADSTATGSEPVNLVLVTVVVTPTTVTVGQNLVQQFTAVAVPDDAPQTFTWTCTPTGSCGSFASNPNNLDVASYTAPPSNGAVVVAATSTVAQTPAASGQAKVKVATSRLPSGTYAFKFSGYDTAGNPVAEAGSFVLATNGTVTDGVEDVLNATGPIQYPIASVSYVPISDNNNLGTLTLCFSNCNTNPVTNSFTAVLTASGVIRMIESDTATTGITGSGIMQQSAANTVFDAGAQTFAFGFTGVDKATGGNRVGYAGILPMYPAGSSQCGSSPLACIVGGLLDSNDNGALTTVCATPPCTVTGSFSQPDATLPTWWNMTLTSGNITQHFDFFVSAGQTQSKTGPNSLTLYAISTDPVDAAQPALSGSMVYQVPMTYNNAAFSGTSVSALTGTNANVSLTLGTTDGKSGGTGGTGGFTGTFDQNNDGTITSVPPSNCAHPTVCAFSYTYVASSSNTGRYTFEMLGSPNGTPVQPPLPFVLYASGANRGFLLDQSSSAVLTGTMDPQPTKAVSSYLDDEMPGVYAAATIGNSNTDVVPPVVQNLLLSSPGGVDTVTGTQNTQSGSQSLTGTYEITTSGTGTITLTAPALPAVATNVIYGIDFDSANSVITDFMMMGTTSGTPSAIIFAQQ